MIKKLLLLSLIILAASIGWYAGYTSSAKNNRFDRRHERIERESRQHREPPTTDEVMSWLKKDYNLTAEQYTAIRKLEEDFRQKISSQFDQMRQDHQAYQKIKKSDKMDSQALGKARTDFRQRGAELHEQFQGHIKQVAALMTPEQSERFLKDIEAHRPPPPDDRGPGSEDRPPHPFDDDDNGPSDSHDQRR